MKIFCAFTLAGILGILATAGSMACTVFSMKAKDGTITIARSMEFGVDLKYDLIVVPRNHAYASPSPVSRTGLSWNTRHGYVAVAAMGMDYGVSDGMNEQGLCVSGLWYENDTRYQEVAPADSAIALAQIIYADWVLGNFATADEVRAATAKIKVFLYSDQSTMKAPVTLHFIVYDAQGGCIVVEYDKGQCNIYDNPLGIMTNAPSLTWHYTNLRQYIGLETSSPIPIKYGGFSFNPTGHGDGMLGLPGDYSPPSRFVRLAMFQKYADRQPDAASNLNLCQHVINTFTIPFGVIVDRDASGKTVANESTQWVTFRDATNRSFYFKTYENPDLRRIDLKKTDFGAKEVKRIAMYGTPQGMTEVR